jgi:hypothetical protein
MRSIVPRSRTGLAARRMLAITLGVVLLMLLTSLGASVFASGATPGRGAPTISVPSTAAHPAVAAHPADITDSYPCQPINTTSCISWSGTGFDIVPTYGNSTSNILPEPNATLGLYIKSKYPLTWVNAPTGDSNQTPIRINVTGVLWNGDPFFSVYDGTVWHANSGSVYWNQVQNVQNTSYPNWYTVSINGLAQGGVPNFFPGEYVTWQIYLVGKTLQGKFVHFLSPQFHYKYAGAWAYSPSPGAEQYGGPASASLDLITNVTPAQPNWNDVVHVTISVTSSDTINRALIGSALLLMTERAPSGTIIASSAFAFPTAGGGTPTTTLNLSSNYAQYPGANVTFTIEAYDNVSSRYTPDEIVTAPQSYLVGGNGSFITKIFSDDVSVTTSPLAIEEQLFPGPVLLPNQSVTMVVASRAAQTALQGVEVYYAFTQPAIHSTASGIWVMTRINSTTFDFTVPSLPIGGFLNFSVLAWDYNDTLDQSSNFYYSVAPLDQVVPTIAPGLGFLWVYVFDNGTQSWVRGATVVFQGAGSFVAITTHTLFGVAYPNASAQPSSPLLLTANVTYNVTVDDPWFVLPGAHSTVNVTYAIALHHTMTYQGTLAQSQNYTIVEDGNALFFWLNTTATGPTFAGGATVQPSTLAPLVGLAAAVLGMALVIPWWRDLAARRREQEKKVTL